ADRHHATDGGQAWRGLRAHVEGRRAGARGDDGVAGRRGQALRSRRRGHDRFHELRADRRARGREGRLDSRDRRPRWRPVARRARAHGPRRHRIRRDEPRRQDGHVCERGADHAGRARRLRRRRARRAPDQGRHSREAGGLAMPFAVLDGINTRYEVVGSGPPLLMFSPGGFDATLEKWSSLSIYAKVKPLDALAKKHSCIVFDRRETGQSGGRVEAIGWEQYVAQGKALLDHLGIERAHMMGGCMGCCPVMAFGVSQPKRVASMILWWPVGGAKYRIKGRARFAEHLAYVKAEGLAAVATLAKSEGKAFGADPRVGPWAAPIRTDVKFAESYAKQDPARYEATVRQMAGNLLD